MPFNSTLMKFACTLALMFVQVSAANAAPQWTGVSTLDMIYPGQDFFIVRVEGTAPVGCSNNQLRLNQSAGTSNYDALVAALTTAFATGSSVNINYDDVSCVIDRLQVYK